MGKRRYLRKDQLAVLEDLFCGELSEQEVLDKHGLSRVVFNRWLTNEAFFERFKKGLKAARLQSELIIARYNALAAARLVQLTESSSAETARKACLDIITFPRKKEVKTKQQKERASGQGQEGKELELSEEQASKILEALAKID